MILNVIFSSISLTDLYISIFSSSIISFISTSFSILHSFHTFHHIQLNHDFLYHLNNVFDHATGLHSNHSCLHVT
ncbi:hypothetical protein HOF65_07435 [bacterium]|nr:hypothetical protein [bacterium]MBT3853746.1 hypothetical protein [bacterium]